MGACVHRGPAFWETWRDGLLIGPFRKRDISRDTANMPCMKVSLHRSPDEKPGGDLLAGTFWIETDSISGVFWDRNG
jgi:hypothetical protein